MSEIKIHPVPGEQVTKFDYNPVAELFDPNLDFKENNLIEKFIKEIYDNQSQSVLQPIVTSIKTKMTDTKSGQSHSIINTNIFIFENYTEEFTKKDFKIYQNYTIGADGRYQLSYYVCYKRSNKKRAEKYRLHKFSLQNIDVEYIPFYPPDSKTEKLDMDSIHDVMAFVINVNPRTSRGTVTTVKSTDKD